jgi:hypothetical protein
MASINKHTHRLGSRSHTNKTLNRSSCGRSELKLFTKTNRQEVKKLLRHYDENVLLPNRKKLF